MTHPIRSILTLAILAVVLAACGTAVAPGSETPAPSQPVTPSQPADDPAADPSQEPSAEEEPAAEERDVAGTVTVAEMAFSGPGSTIQEALDAGPGGDLPTLVNGVLFRDSDGTIYLATSVSDTSAPTFDGPMLEVLGMENEGPSWDMASAEILGLEQANGIVFKQDAQVLGFIDLP